MEITKMESIQGYFDGTVFKSLEHTQVKPNQRVIITIMDDFIESSNVSKIRQMKGILSKYANPELIEKEEGAWERVAGEKHGVI